MTPGSIAPHSGSKPRYPRGLLRYALLTAIASACGDSTAPKEPADAIKIAVGEVQTIDPTTTATAHVSGRDAGAEYTLVASYATQGGGPDVGLQITAEAIADVAGPPNPRVSPASGALLLNRSAINQKAAVELRLRASENAQLTRLIPEARRAYAARSLTATPASVPVLGDEMQLNVSLDACGTPVLHTGRTMTVSDHAVLVEDEANPSGGFTASDYDSIAQELESLIYPVLAENFGTPSDVDNNGGRLIVFITRGVNELAPPGSGIGITGFSYDRDLVPKTTCAGSNEAELIYVLAPDPAGAIGGNVVATTWARQLVGGTIAHSGQSLISAGRRLYVTHAPFEMPWLNQGLGAIAEELVFYKAAGVGSRRNFTLDFLRSSATIHDALNTYQGVNLARLTYYLGEPESHSPVLDDGTFASGGASWEFLRYVADHSTMPEATLWYNLVNSSQTGVASLATVTGADVATLEHQWAVAQYADDAGFSVASALQQPSWNFRDVLPAFNTDGRFPLAVQSLTGSSPLSITLKAGGASYVRFAVPASQTATLHFTVTGAPTGTGAFSLMLLRTK